MVHLMLWAAGLVYCTK